MNNEIVTRFAPSPTGEPHIGNFRTALFEYLFAKQAGGKFLLRIEDTDRERYVESSVQTIKDLLSWLGIIPDNIDEPAVQSERLELYQKYARELVEKGDAYICTCSKEDLEAERKEQEAKHLPPKYSGRCREKNLQLNSYNLQLPEGAVIRMKMPQSGKIVIHDLIRGDVEFDLSLSDDQVILKSDGFPTYHLAAIVDDHEMNVTHVIRGEEWLSSTPKHLTLYNMFGWEAPKFAHLSMILAPDKTKLSKRHGATSVTEFKNLGYLPEALINFIALLGWNPKDNRELFTLEELVKEFKVENVNKAPAIFDLQKLNNINSIYLVERIKNKELRIKDLEQFGLENITDGEWELLGRGGFNTLKEMADYIIQLRKEPEYNPAILIFKKSDKEKTISALKIVELRIMNYELWNLESLQELLSTVVTENSFSNGDVFWPVRVALSGAEKSPSPAELALALGKEETTARIQAAINLLKL